MFKTKTIYASCLFTVLMSLSVVACVQADDDQPTTQRQQAMTTDQWTEIETQSADDGQIGDSFGDSLDVSGDLAIVGAPDHEGSSSNEGAAYIYQRDDRGQWIQRQKLEADDAVKNARFGVKVAISGDHAAVIAPGATNGEGKEPGAVYFYSRDDQGVWKFTQKYDEELVNGFAVDRYSDISSISMDGDTVAIGHPEANFFGFGSFTFILRRQASGQWVREAFFQKEQFFGISVDLDGDRLVVGSSTGALAHVYRRTGTTWQEEGTLKKSNGAAENNFGGAIAIDGDLVVVGASDEPNGGMVYFYEFDSGQWQETDRKQLPAATGRRFGSSVAIYDQMVVVGDYAANMDDGAVYTYVRQSNAKWLGKQSLRVPQAKARFGRAIGITADALLVGAPHLSKQNKGTLSVFSNKAKPEAADVTWTLDEDTPYNGKLLEGAPQSARVNIITQPKQGTLVVVDEAEGTFTYTPNADYNGADEFTYTIIDGGLISDEAKVTLTISPINDAPTFVDPTPKDNAAIVVEAGQVVSIDLAGMDVDGDTLTYAIEGLPNGLNLQNSTSLQWTTSANDAGSYQLTLSVSDGAAQDQRRVQVEVKGVKKPDTDGDGVSDDEDNCPMTFNTDQTDTDADGVGNACDETPAPKPTTQDNDDDGGFLGIGGCQSTPKAPSPADLLWLLVPMMVLGRRVGAMRSKAQKHQG